MSGHPPSRSAAGDHRWTTAGVGTGLASAPLELKTPQRQPPSRCGCKKSYDGDVGASRRCSRCPPSVSVKKGGVDRQTDGTACMPQWQPPFSRLFSVGRTLTDMEHVKCPFHFLVACPLSDGGFWTSWLPRRQERAPSRAKNAAAGRCSSARALGLLSPSSRPRQLHFSP